VGVTLLNFARQFLVSKEKLLASLTTPVLVWEAASHRTREDRQSWLPTDAGGAVSRPRKGEAVAFLVEKAKGSKNAFPMGVTVGRIDSNDIVVDDGSLSRFHAWFQHDERKGTWSLTDAESRNGTWVNDLAVRKNAHVPVADGDAVRFGEVPMRFFLPEGFVRYLETLTSQ
jgi:FHA domain